MMNNYVCISMYASFFHIFFKLVDTAVKTFGQL